MPDPLNEQQIEEAVTQKGLTAPRLTPQKIDEKIIGDFYWNVPGTSATVCALILENGFVVTGLSAAASMENFDEELGKQIAWRNAREKIWQLEGYLLRQELHEEEELGEAQESAEGATG